MMSRVVVRISAMPAMFGGRNRVPTTITLALPLLLMLAGLGSSGCGGARAGQPEYKTARVIRGDIEHRVIATGRIEPFSKVEIRSKVDGIIKALAVDEGDSVSRGQTILELDRDIPASRVREARATLEKLKARHQQAQIEADASKIDLDSAHKKCDRMQQLWAQGLATKEQMEDAEAVVATAREHHRARWSSVGMAQAELSAAAAALDRAENELGYATVVSPVDGIVLSRNVDVGSAVASVASTLGTLLMVLGDMREMHMVGDVDESDVGLVREGMPARITVESYRDRRFHGTVRKISPLGVEKEKIMNFEVEVSIEQADVPLRTNMTADAEIILEKRSDVLLIPQNAIRYKHNQIFVEVPSPEEENGKTSINVTLGISGADFSEVLSGLKEGDEVIVSGA